MAHNNPYSGCDISDGLTMVSPFVYCRSSRCVPIRWTQCNICPSRHLICVLSVMRLNYLYRFISQITFESITFRASLLLQDLILRIISLVRSWSCTVLRDLLCLSSSNHMYDLDFVRNWHLILSLRQLLFVQHESERNIYFTFYAIPTLVL